MGDESQSKRIREYLITSASLLTRGLAVEAAEQFGISRQAAHKHLKALVDSGVLVATGATRGRQYRLAVKDRVLFKKPITRSLEEDAVWAQEVRPHMEGVPENVMRICHYGFTEMLNNVVDHSEGTTVSIKVTRTAGSIEMWIADNGVGIFNKIQKALSLPDPRLSILELAKGKLTTDPVNHTGEGIFFSSRAFDMFKMVSGNLFYSHETGDDDWLIESSTSNQRGTVVLLVATTSTHRTMKEVFDRYSGGEHYTFCRTHVPLSLAQFGDDQLVSRSQAKRVLSRVDRFEEVLLDFHGVTTIGQAFADEIFRVFVQLHPQIKIVEVNTSDQVKSMIARAKANRNGAKP